MQQKYIYSFNGIANWLRGVITLPAKGTQAITQANSSHQLIWRNHFTQGYKVAEGYN